MPFSRIIRLRSILVLGLVIFHGLLSSATAAPKPVLLYSRYFNAIGEARYLPEGTYKEILTRMDSDFEVRVHSQVLTAKVLENVQVLLIANPSDKAAGTNPPPPHVSRQDIRNLTRFVQRGGGLIVMGNQENHNLETADLNQLLTQFGLQFTNRYTDVKMLPVPEATPIIGGLRWAYYTGDSVLLALKSSAHPRSLVDNDLSRPPLSGNRNSDGSLLAVSEPGRGRVIVITDSGWITDDALSGRGIAGVAIKEQDNLEIFRRLARWAGGRN